MMISFSERWQRAPMDKASAFPQSSSRQLSMPRAGADSRQVFAPTESWRMASRLPQYLSASVQPPSALLPSVPRLIPQHASVQLRAQLLLANDASLLLSAALRPSVAARRASLVPRVAVPRCALPLRAANAPLRRAGV